MFRLLWLHKTGRLENSLSISSESPRNIIGTPTNCAQVPSIIPRRQPTAIAPRDTHLGGLTEIR